MNSMIIDDDEDILNLYLHFLKDGQFNITTFCCPKEALDHFHSAKVDFIITDIIMPKMNGIDLTKRLREFSKTVPILVCSEGGTTESRDIVADILLHQALNYGATHALLKPFNKQELLEAVHETVRIGKK